MGSNYLKFEMFTNVPECANENLTVERQPYFCIYEIHSGFNDWDKKQAQKERPLIGNEGKITE